MFAYRHEEERSSRLKEELLTLREELSNLYLSRDMLEQQRLESDSLIAHIEKAKGWYLNCEVQKFYR